MIETTQNTTGATIIGADRAVTEFRDQPGPRAGDYLVYQDSRAARIADVLPGESGQPCDRNGSWFPGEQRAYVIYPGALEPAIPLARLTLTGGARLYFDQDWPRDHSAVYVQLPCRVYTVAAD